MIRSNKGSQSDSSKRGLASASEETRLRVAKSGGRALHTKRGLQGARIEVRIEVARKGGLARGKQRHQEKEKLMSIERVTEESHIDFDVT